MCVCVYAATMGTVKCTYSLYMYMYNVHVDVLYTYMYIHVHVHCTFRILCISNSRVAGSFLLLCREAFKSGAITWNFKYTVLWSPGGIRKFRRPRCDEPRDDSGLYADTIIRSTQRSSTASLHQSCSYRTSPFACNYIVRTSLRTCHRIWVEDLCSRYGPRVDYRHMPSLGWMIVAGLGWRVFLIVSTLGWTEDALGRIIAALGRTKVALGWTIVALGRTIAALGRTEVALGWTISALGQPTPYIISR